MAGSSRGQCAPAAGRRTGAKCRPDSVGGCTVWPRCRPTNAYLGTERSRSSGRLGGRAGVGRRLVDDEGQFVSDSSDEEAAAPAPAAEEDAAAEAERERQRHVMTSVMMTTTDVSKFKVVLFADQVWVSTILPIVYDVDASWTV